MRELTNIAKLLFAGAVPFFAISFASSAQAQPVQCAMPFEASNALADVFTDFTAPADEPLITIEIDQSYFDNVALELIERFLANHGPTQETPAAVIRALGQAALPLLEFSKDKWPAKKSAIESLIEEVKSARPDARDKLVITSSTEPSGASTGLKTCLRDPEARSQIRTKVENLKKAWSAYFNQRRRPRPAPLLEEAKNRSQELRQLLGKYDHATCFVGEARLSHVCPLLQLGANNSDGSRGGPFSEGATGESPDFWIEATDADDKPVFLRQPLADGIAPVWEVFDSKGRNKKRLGYLADQDGDGLFDDVLLLGAGSSGHSTIDPTRMFSDDFEAQRQAASDVCESGFLSNPAASFGAIAKRLGWKASDVFLSVGDAYLRGAIEGAGRAAFVASNSVADTLLAIVVEAPVLLWHLATNPEFRSKFWKKIKELAAPHVRNTVWSSFNCIQELPAALGFAPPAAISASLCSLNVGADIAAKLFLHVWEKGKECVGLGTANWGQDEDAMAKCFAEISTVAATSAILGVALGAASVKASAIAQPVVRVAARGSLMGAEFVFDPGLAGLASKGVTGGARRVANAADRGARLALSKKLSELSKIWAKAFNPAVKKELLTERLNGLINEYIKKTNFVLTPDSSNRAKRYIEYLFGADGPTPDQLIDELRKRIEALKLIRKEGAFKLLGDIATTSPNPTVAEAAIDALASTNTSEAFKLLGDIATTSPNPTVATQAIDALASTNTKEAVEVLGEIAKKRPDLAEAAIDALASTNTSEAFKLLGDIATTSPNPTVAEAAIAALASTNTKEAFKLLGDIATTSPNPTVATQAIDALASTNTKEAVEVLGEIAKKRPDLAEAAIDALASTNTKEAVEVLGDIASSNSPYAQTAAAALNLMTPPLGVAAKAGAAGQAGAAAFVRGVDNPAQDIADLLEIEGLDRNALFSLRQFEQGWSDLYGIFEARVNRLAEDARVDSDSLNIWLENVSKPNQLNSPDKLVRMLDELRAVEDALRLTENTKLSSGSKVKLVISNENGKKSGLEGKSIDFKIEHIDSNGAITRTIWYEIKQSLDVWPIGTPQEFLKRKAVHLDNVRKKVESMRSQKLADVNDAITEQNVRLIFQHAKGTDVYSLADPDSVLTFDAPRNLGIDAALVPLKLFKLKASEIDER